MKKLLISAAVSVAALSAANAAILDFEQFGADNGDLAPITAADFVTDFGISFTSTDGIRVIKVGPAQDGFVPNDTPNPADAFGEYFLGTAFDDRFTDLTITYTNPVKGLSFDLGDIDDDEVFTIKVFGAGDTLLQTDVITAGVTPGTGNQSVFTYGVSNLAMDIVRVEIEGERGGNRLGIAFDNFNVDRDVTVVPVPAAAPLFGAALLTAAARRRRKA